MTIYYSKLKALWDDLNLYSPIPPCICESNKTIEASKDKDITIQFLMGLNETYMGVYDQVLLMGPIPIVGKVSSLLL